MNNVLRFLKRLAACNKGSLMLEFAIGSSVLLTAFAGTFQFG
jgi:Flp pilus assembly protein TadG